jgi:hypothetical protein
MSSSPASGLVSVRERSRLNLTALRFSSRMAGVSRSGIVARRVVAVGGRGDQTLVASAPTTGRHASWTLETVSGRFEGFADNWGFFTSGFPASKPDSVMLSLYAWNSTDEPRGAVPISTG